MTERTRASWPDYVLGALCAGAIAAAILLVGPASGSQPSQSRTVTVASGVVQSTVSGSGNLQAASQLNLGFKTSGAVTHIYVTQGEQVAEGQLLATLDPQSAEVTLEQTKTALQSAEANLAREEETDGETSAGSSGSSPVASSASAPVSEPTPASTTTAPTTGAPRERTTTAPTTTKASEHTATTTTPTISSATREANLSSARATVRSDRLTVQGDEGAVQDTKLYAPEDGTIVSLAGQVGETVSGGGTTRDSASASGGSGSSATGDGVGAAATGARSGSAGSSSSSGSSNSSSTSAFAVLSDLSSMQLVAPLSESEVGNVKAGQIATVTVEALESRKLAAHVKEVAILSTSNSGVVSYDVTFQLDQMEAGLKPGMSATGEVVVKQAEGVNVPTTAISGGAVTVLEHGKQVRRTVVTGLKGDSSTIVLSGLKAGELIALPIATSGGASSVSTLRSRLGRAGGLGGGGGLAGGAGGAGGFAGGGFFRGGGG